MTDAPRSGAHAAFGDIAPDFADLTEDMLFGQIWQRPELSARDRSLITCAALVATGRTEQMTGHFPRAVANGVTRDELIGLIIHLAFDTGWPGSVSAMLRLMDMPTEPPSTTE